MWGSAVEPRTVESIWNGFPCWGCAGHSNDRRMITTVTNSDEIKSLLPYPEKIRYFGTRIDLPSCNFMKQGKFWETNNFLCFGCSNESVWFRVVIENFVIYFYLVFILDNMWVSVLKSPPSAWKQCSISTWRSWKIFFPWLCQNVSRFRIELPL